MIPPDPDFVFHGSHERFGTAVPRQNRRIRGRPGSEGYEVIFDRVSFHATPYRWIGLAYTYDPVPVPFEGRHVRHNMGVSLYRDSGEETQVHVHGFGSLEESLRALYGQGGYLYVFEKERFHHAEGLGDLEVISTVAVDPVRVERIEDPVAEMRQTGVKFKFVDLADPANADVRNYAREDEGRGAKLGP